MKAIEKRAKKDDTFGKAPNSNDSNLNDFQWTQVRTEPFKGWFGDWELSERLKAIDSIDAEEVDNLPAGKTYKEVYQSLGDGVNKRDGVVVKFFNRTFYKIVKSSLISERVVPSLKKIFDNSVLLYSEPENQGGTKRLDGTIHKEHRSVYEVRNYIGKTLIDGKEHYVRFTVFMQKNHTGVHSYYVTDVDVYKNTTTGNASYLSLSKARLVPSGDVDAKLQKHLESAKENEKKVSKIVDENGEPLVVYHQTNSKELVNVDTGENWNDLDWREKDAWRDRDDFDEHWKERDFYTFDNKNYGRRSGLNSFKK